MCERLSLMSGELADKITSWQPAEINAYEEDDDAEFLPFEQRFEYRVRDLHRFRVETGMYPELR